MDNDRTLRMQMLGQDNDLRKAGKVMSTGGVSKRVEDALEQADPVKRVMATPQGAMSQADFANSGAAPKVDPKTRAAQLAAMLRKRNAEFTP